ncbi:unnamed protein product [Brassica napus]|uniref:Ferredoxin-thioredoxin reductase catalytic chain, chloroplastic n=2 Tax=Magnoliopsida TaxID=3398 RepID=A0A816JSF1_BRANA|nr:unnamed protein product [Brassica napus]
MKMAAGNEQKVKKKHHQPCILEQSKTVFSSSKSITLYNNNSFPSQRANHKVSFLYSLLHSFAFDLCLYLRRGLGFASVTVFVFKVRLLPPPPITKLRRMLSSFYIQLYKIVDDRSSDPIISWSKSSPNVFVVWDLKKLRRDILMKSSGVLLGRNITEFIAKLRSHGFRSVLKGFGELEFEHDGLMLKSKPSSVDSKPRNLLLLSKLILISFHNLRAEEVAFSKHQYGSNSGVKTNACKHYDDKAAEVGQGFWNCPCVPMRERKECHCMLFLTPDNDFAGKDQTITSDEIKETTAHM